MSGDLVMAAYVMFHPCRQRILKILEKGGRLTLEETAAAIDLSPDIVAFHLAALEQHGLVGGDFKPVSSIPKAVRYFEATPKVEEVLQAADTLV